MSSDIGKAMLITWAEFGIVVEKTKVDEQGHDRIYISVPEHSYHKDVHNEEMSGMKLASRIKTTLKDLGATNVILLARVRKGETWTEEQGKSARENMLNSVRRL